MAQARALFYAATALLVLLIGAPAAPLAAAERAPLKLLAFGDSLIHGFGLAAAETLPAQLEQALRDAGYPVEVLNGGNSGDTTASGLARLDWSLAEEPDLVLLALGANDGLRGIDPADTAANLDTMLSELERRGIPVLLAGMLAPRNLGADYGAEFDSLYPRLAEKHEAAFYPFLLEGVALEPDLNQADGIHPNAEGVAVIVEGLVPHLTPLLDRLEAKSAGG